jgi:hypothetical protein
VNKLLSIFLLSFSCIAYSLCTENDLKNNIVCTLKYSDGQLNMEGEVVEHKPYDFSNIFQSQPAPVTPPALSNEPSTTGLCEQIELCELNSLVGDNSTTGK